MSLLRTLFLLGILLLQIILVAGCLPLSTLSKTTVINLSGKQPYKAFIGKYVIAKEGCSIWVISSPSYDFMKTFVRLGLEEDVPSYRTDLKKIADVPIGTRVKIHSIKHKKVTTEMSGYDSTQALCTVFLPDGQKIDCQMNWDLLNPDPRLWPTLKFKLIGK
jgi:hypothetical protein